MTSVMGCQGTKVGDERRGKERGTRVAPFIHVIKVEVLPGASKVTGFVYGCVGLYSLCGVPVLI